jgi:glutamine amidotransferase
MKKALLILGSVGLLGFGLYRYFKNQADILKKFTWKISGFKIIRFNANELAIDLTFLFSSSAEHKFSKGLNLLKGDFGLIESNLLIPHVGWNDCEIKKKKIDLFKGINNNSDFYFTHSYILKKYEEKDIIAYTKYGIKFPSAAKKNNIYGVQFHPEKSQDKGLLILKNFYEMC